MPKPQILGSHFPLAQTVFFFFNWEAGGVKVEKLPLDLK